MRILWTAMILALAGASAIAAGSNIALVRARRDMGNCLYGISGGYAFIRQPNVRIFFSEEPLNDKPYLRHHFATTRYIQDGSGAKHVSVNALLYPAGYPLARLLRSKWVYAPEWLPNTYLVVPVKPLWLSLHAGQNTEYYLSSRGGSIHTETVAGIKFFPLMPISVDWRVPWSKGFLNSKRPYLSASLEFNQMSLLIAYILLGGKLEFPD